MKQVIQNLKSGETSLEDVPKPAVSSGNVLIKTIASLISPGTEKMLLDFGRSGYLSKAMQQPHKVKEVFNKIKTDGLESTYEAVQSKLSMPIPLGYCNVGEIIEVGSNVNKLSVGDRVISNGNHAELVLVPENLCARVPDNISNDQASFVVLSAIALQGIRLANLTIGERVAVIGLGAIGLMAVQILIAHGCRVLAFDINDERLQLAKSFGADIVNSSGATDTKQVVENFTSGYGMDAVIITASSNSHEIVHQAAEMSRKRGRIILVGVVGLNISREDFYEKELTFQVSCSYGPGRYDASYEYKGIDYPYAFVRWTEQRNFEAILSLMQTEKIDPTKLITEKVMLEDAPALYDKLAKGYQGLGMVIEYSSSQPNITTETVPIDSTLSKYENQTDQLSIGFFGAGNYASRVLIPKFKSRNSQLHTIVTSKGLSGTILGKKHKFKYSSTDKNAIFKNEKINLVAIATRHDSHAELVSESMKSLKHVFVEKPLSINLSGLHKIKETYYDVNKKNLSDHKIHLMVGFNRRFSPYIQKIKSLLETEAGPKSFVMTMNAGSVPYDHWVNDLNVGGGRIIGEACHYIDLMRFLVGKKITNFSAHKMGHTKLDKNSDDASSITLEFQDGSIGTIHYFSNGHQSFPKETIEIFSNNKVLRLDNFRALRGYGWKNFRSMKSWKQEKGQDQCIKAFINSINSGSDAIPADELFEIAEITLSIAEILEQ